MRLPAIVAAGAAIGGALLLRRNALREDLDWASVDKPGAIIDVDGYSAHYIEAGTGPPIVLLHGFGGHTISFRNLMPLLAARHRAIAIDLKGFGYSERDATTDMSRAAQVAMVAGLLDRLGVDRAVMLGHSMGGAVAQRYAATHPERVEALVLAATAADDERRFRARPLSPMLRPLLPVLGGIAANRLLKLSFYDPAMLTDELRDGYLRPARIRGSMDGLMKLMRDAVSDPPVDYARITMPVLILAGAHDRVAPLRLAQQIRARIPHARLVVIEKSAHLLLEERAADAAGAIEDSLRDAGRGELQAAPGVSG